MPEHKVPESEREKRISRIEYNVKQLNQSSPASPVISVALWKDEREEEVEDDIAVVHAVVGHVGYEPVPKLGEGPSSR